MCEGAQAEEGPKTTQPGGQEVTVPKGQELLPGTSQTVRSRDEARRAEIRVICLREFASGKLPLHFVGVDVDHRRRAATVFFTSEVRVDFRELCRALCRALRVRVTLHRLGPRDLARRAGTCAPCGRALCCRSFLSSFPSVSVRLVKDQKFPLTPERSAGMCGRLKCCLAFERGDGACPHGGSGVFRPLDAANGDAESSPRTPHI